jgi:nitroreductase
MLEPMSAADTSPAAPPAAASEVASLEAFTELARARRTSLLVDRDRSVPDELLEQLLELATWAPNHKRTWPWRFTVVSGQGRARLGELVAAYEERRGSDPAKVDKARGKYLRSPVVLLVGAAWQPDETRRIEDRDAVAAAVQNLLLGATAAGLASHWATGDWMSDEAIKAFAGLAPEDQLIALVYLGWPRGTTTTVARPQPVVTRIEA